MRNVGITTKWQQEYIVLPIIISILIFCMISLDKLNYYSETIRQKEFSPFLLEYSNSAKEAEIKVIIWFQNQKSLEQVRHILPSENWHWEESLKYRDGGKKSVSLVGRTKVDKFGELNLKKWYLELTAKIKKAGGQVYLDERISENIDIAAYLSQVGAEPEQWMLDYSTLSVAALKSDLGNEIYAGKDQVNLQLLTRFNKGTQQSVLALPVLIEEF